jgi:hypothetical protein
MKGPDTNKVGPGMRPLLIASRTAMLSSSGAPRSRAPVTPASSSCLAEAGMMTSRNWPR